MEDGDLSIFQWWKKMAKKTIVKHTVKEGDVLTVADLIATKADLSKEKIKKAMMNGSCWLKKGSRRGKNRIRKAKTPVRVGDTIEFYYDPEINFPSAEGFQVIHERSSYGIWNKLPGMLSQGTKFGDAGSVLKEVSKIKNNESFLVHRLDKEVGGLIVVAYNRKAASKLSELFRTDKVEKYYRCWVLGNLENKEGLIEEPLDDKPSKTSYKVLEEKEGMSLLEVRIYTGRTHQIRRHLDGIGHPVMGDPRYGKNNKNEEGLQLASYRLCFDNLDKVLDDQSLSKYLSI